MEIPKRIRYFVLLLDTSSYIQTFPPPFLVRDPSYRPIEVQEEGNQLVIFRPLIVSHPFDVHFTRVSVNQNHRSSPKKMAECRESHEKGSVLSWENHITLEIELRGGGIASMKFVHRFSIIFARVGDQVSPVSHYGSVIMAGSMATMGRESCITIYAHFPVLLGEYGGNMHRTLEKNVFRRYTRVWCLGPLAKAVTES